MQSDTDPIHHLTEADRDSQTRFGVREVPEGHKTAAPYPHRPMRSSPIPPSDEGPYRGLRRRKASLTAKVVLLGGAGIMAAAATAAAIMAGRKLGDAVSGDSRGGPMTQARPQRSMAPRFAEMDEDQREAIRRRDHERAMRERNQIARSRAIAARERVAPRVNVARDFSETARDLSGNLNGLVNALTGAAIGFRQVATQAGDIMREFTATADAVRGYLDGGERRHPPQSPRGGRDDRDRTHRL